MRSEPDRSSRHPAILGYNSAVQSAEEVVLRSPEGETGRQARNSRMRRLFEVPPIHTASPDEAFTGKRPLGALLALLLLAAPSFAADSKPNAKPRVQPIRTVSVRLMPAGTIAEPFKITTLTAKSCSVTVDDPAQMGAAFQACMKAVPEAEGCRTLTVDGQKVRAVMLPNGTWQKARCDQGKAKGAAK